jgi:D-glycero-D-manno-heptose 1,7-bisphosphate phosphatase
VGHSIVVRGAVFLDRDGVIIENRPDYVRTWKDVVFLPGVFPALRRLAVSNFRVLILTNQSAVGRGLISLETAEDINRGVVQTIAQEGGRIDSVYMCPHKPADNCPCRKPAAGLIFQAAKEFSLDLKHSCLIGDAVTDLMAGQAAGVGELILVRTGRGSDQAAHIATSGIKAYKVCRDLAHAVASLPLDGK